MWKWLVPIVLAFLTVSGSLSADDDIDLEVDTGLTLTTQQCSNWCWAASVEMLSHRYGTPVFQCEVVSAKASDPTCCGADACGNSCNHGANDADTVTAAMEAFRIYGIYEPSYLSQGTLRMILDSGSPILAATIYHVFVISGYRRDNRAYSYHVLDPFPTIGDHWVSYADLRNYNYATWAFSWYNLE